MITGKMSGTKYYIILKEHCHFNFVTCFRLTKKAVGRISYNCGCWQWSWWFFFAGKVLPLGDVTSCSQFLEPDGLFSNHIPYHENRVAMKAITQVVLDKKADLGIIFVTDVDRSAVDDSTRRDLNRNRLSALKEGMPI
ncbi:putative alpha-D-phosphohexomutase, alpha/beta/alpha domain II [Helianthus anomalus]